MFLIVQQKSALNTYQQWSGVSGSGGVTMWPGLRAYNVMYAENAIDPTGRFYSSSITSFHTIIGGAVNTEYIDLTVAASHDITPTVPSCSAKQKKNVSFTVKGTFSKSIANGKQISILAIKGGTQKSFGGAIKSNKYSAKVKLSKGTWTLYALFSGNATFAANDSLAGKVVTVK
jgi:hypothetical protein